jgi:hypothetical protein
VLVTERIGQMRMMKNGLNTPKKGMEKDFEK